MIDAPLIDAIDAPFDDTAPVNCPASYASIGVAGSKYRANGNSFTWTQAQAMCVADGTHLVVFQDDAERAMVTALLPGDNQWVGVTDRITLGTWLAVTGATATYLPWEPSEPDLTADERCVAAKPSSFNYEDNDCLSGRRFVCECDGTPSNPSSY
jgi:hypothetical protein